MSVKITIEDDEADTSESFDLQPDGYRLIVGVDREVTGETVWPTSGTVILTTEMIKR